MAKVIYDCHSRKEKGEEMMTTGMKLIISKISGLVMGDYTRVTLSHLFFCLFFSCYYLFSTSSYGLTHHDLI